MEKETILVSACLLGVNCRYNGGGELHTAVEKLKDTYHLVPVCPEIMGGLATPRDPAERVGDKVLTCNGSDVTLAYEKGAAEILKLAKFYNCKRAILKERSPSCGFGKIYDGTFSHTQIDGNGVLADALSKSGLTIVGESKIETCF